MASITLTDPIAGTTVTAGLHAGNNSALRTAINGTLDSTNLAAGAAIKGSQLATGITGPPGTQLDYVEVTTNSQTTTVTSAATAAAIITGSAVVYDGTTAVWVDWQLPQALHSVTGAEIVFELYDGASDLGYIAIAASGNSGFGPTVRASRRFTPSAATHTYSVRMWSPTAGTTTAISGNGTAGLALPMFLRITKA